MYARIRSYPGVDHGPVVRAFSPAWASGGVVLGAARRLEAISSSDNSGEPQAAAESKSDLVNSPGLSGEASSHIIHSIALMKGRHMNRNQAIRSFGFVVSMMAVLSVGMMWAQTRTTGDLSGVVADPEGAVVANASIALTHKGTGATLTSSTDSDGSYRFALLPPGEYSATASKWGFQTITKAVQVSVGGSATANFQFSAVSSLHEVIVVRENAAEVETNDANLNTTFTAKQIELQPNPGNDLSAVALTTPGAVMNTAGGALTGGNFEVYGLPSTSNLFTVDGASITDPYFNINSTGAANLTLGLNDVQESTVVANGYSGTFGGAAGATVSFVSKSGTNSLHGNAIYWWNGGALNANEYFRKSQGLPRLFANANQYAASLGGPIKKDKAFFFFDTEGIYLAVPSPGPLNLPTVPFENAVLGNLSSLGLSDAVNFYQNQIFPLYNGVPQTGAQQIFNGGCSDVTTVNGIPFGTSSPCAVQVQTGPLGYTHDRVYIGRYDQNLSAKDSIFIRVQYEHGHEDTYEDPVSPNFNVVSDQPEWQSQAQEIHVFNPSIVNVFNASLLWYSSDFSMKNPAAASASFPSALVFADGSLGSLNPGAWEVPQGRNTTQYQFLDDFSWTRGRHNLRFGASFRRADISDKKFLYQTPLIVEGSLGDFITGGGGAPTGNEIVQNFPSRTDMPIAMYQFGFYAADDVRVTKNFNLTLNLRFDRFSNPVCQVNCFARLSGIFGQLNTAAPVNQAITSGLHTAFPSVAKLIPEPKIGFAWTPFDRARKTVIRGGAGIFADILPTGALNSFLQNPPLDPGFINAFLPITPDPLTLNLWTASLGSYQEFQADYASGGAVPPLNFYNATTVKAPRYYEWSLEAQQDLGWNSSLSVKYVGNHGSHEEISNSALNAFNASFAPAQFGNDLPLFPPDPRFAVVTQQQNIANSNYDGLVVDVKHDFNGGVHFEAGYIWSHALDEISNNSLSPFGPSSIATVGVYQDIISPQDPYNIRTYNYGNADYDVQHSFTMNYVWSNGLRHLTSRGPNALMKGWSFSGTILRHSGLPFTVVSSTATSALESTVDFQTNPPSVTAAYYGTPGGYQSVFADIVGPTSHSCSASATKTPCLLASNFADPTNDWGQQSRNQFRGPGYFDSDFAVEKAFGLFKEGREVSLGARLFNVFNHPNFYYPVMNIDNPFFGSIIQTTGSPTSIYGVGLGANSSPRLIQLQAKVVF